MLDVLDIDGYEWISESEVTETIEAYNFYSGLNDFYENDTDLNAPNPSRENARQALVKVQNYIKDFREIYGEKKGATVASSVDQEFWYIVDYWEQGGRKVSSVENETPEVAIKSIKEDIEKWTRGRTKLLIDSKYSAIIFSYDKIIELYKDYSQTAE